MKIIRNMLGRWMNCSARTLTHHLGDMPQNKPYRFSKLLFPNSLEEKPLIFSLHPNSLGVSEEYQANVLTRILLVIIGYPHS